MEQSVFSDPRYRILAREIGVDLWSAIGRMTALWNHCQETNSYVLSNEVVNHLFDDAPRLAEGLLKSKLGKPHRHGIYISGTRGRIEWLQKKRDRAKQNGTKGGRPPVTKPEPTDNQRGLQPVTPPAPAPAPAPAREKKVNPSGLPKKSAKELVEGLAVDDELRDFARRLGHNADALLEDWRDYFRSNGYLVGGKTPIKDARASFLRWIRNAKPSAQKPTSSASLFTPIRKSE